MSSPFFQWKLSDGSVQVLRISGPDVLIGRSADADVVLGGQHVSRRHARLLATSDGYVIEDLGSTYGTFVNGERVTRRLLRPGDTVVLGRETLEFQFGDPDVTHVARDDSTTTLPGSFDNLSRVLPSAETDLEKIQYILDFQYQWNEVFTPERCWEHVLDSAVKISGAERGFILTRLGTNFGYAAGLDGSGRPLTEADFQASRSVVREVVDTGRPVFMVEGLEDQFAVQASIMAMNLRAVACLPLRGIPTDGSTPEILGILYLDSTRAMHSLTGLDEKILTGLAVEAGNVLERVELLKTIEQRKLLERDLALAEETQRSLLPQDVPELDHLRLHAFSKPTRYVGGDFYHFHVGQDGAFTGLLADVSGKGVAASLLSSMLLGCIEMMLSSGHSPEATLNELNRYFCRKSAEKFVTIFLFSVDPDGSAQYVSAGHNPGYLYRASTKTIEELPSTGLLLGAFDFVSYEATSFSLEPGDVLLAYSDGLTEAENPEGEMLDEERVKDLVLRAAPSGADGLGAALLTAIQEFTRGHPQTDDVTLVIAEWV